MVVECIMFQSTVEKYKIIKVYAFYKATFVWDVKTQSAFHHLCRINMRIKNNKQPSHNFDRSREVRRCHTWTASKRLSACWRGSVVVLEPGKVPLIEATAKNEWHRMLGCLLLDGPRPDFLRRLSQICRCGGFLWLREDHRLRFLVFVCPENRKRSSVWILFVTGGGGSLSSYCWPQLLQCGQSQDDRLISKVLPDFLFVSYLICLEVVVSRLITFWFSGFHFSTSCPPL